MFHKACRLTFCDGTVLEVMFQDGAVKQYDIAQLFGKYPQLQVLQDPELFCQGKLMGGYGIIWNDEADLEVETIYEEGVTVRQEPVTVGLIAGNAVASARAEANISQRQLAERTGIDQSDLSKIERGAANPSVGTLKRIADALGKNLRIVIE